MNKLLEKLVFSPVNPAIRQSVSTNMFRNLGFSPSVEVGSSIDAYSGMRSHYQTTVLIGRVNSIQADLIDGESLSRLKRTSILDIRDHVFGDLIAGLQEIEWALENYDRDRALEVLKRLHEHLSVDGL